MEKALPTEPSITEISPRDFEKHVVDWLRATTQSPDTVQISHLKKVAVSSGEYELDGVATFDIWNGIKFSILIECKRYNRPVKRDTVILAHAKTRELSMQKTMVVSTSGFQKGAIEFATEKNVALIQLVDGRTTYFTRSAEQVPPEYFPDNLPDVAGWLVSKSDHSYLISTIESNNIEYLQAWLEL